MLIAAGSFIGGDVTRALCEAPNPLDRYGDSILLVATSEASSPKSGPSLVAVDLRGNPLGTTSMLAAAWKTGGMDHLAGYEQRDAHEFLHAFLDNVGKPGNIAN